MAHGFIIAPNEPDPWLVTASGARTGNGAAATITWSIVPDNTITVRDTTTNATAPSNLISFMNTNFGGNPGESNLTLQPWFHIFTDAFGRWSQLGGINFVFEPNDDGVFHPSDAGALGVRGDIRLAGANIDGLGNILALSNLPPSGSDLILDTSEVPYFGSSTQNFLNFRYVLMHEIGHTFGLLHVSTTSALLMEPQIDTSFDGPQLDEVRGVQYFFGDANEKSNGGLGNESAATATSLGPIPPGGTRKIGAAADVPTQAIGPTATDFVSISNARDQDFYSFSVSGPSELAVSLTPRGGVFSQAEQFSVPASFDANVRNNLGLVVYSPDGNTRLVTADSNPAGSIESVSNLLLPAAGTYFTRITGRDDTIQLYELLLTATPVLLGDYDKNGVVDGADYVVWRSTMGQSVAIGAAADGDFDGHVTSADYGVWRSHFGQVAAYGTGSSAVRSDSSVPEPNCILLCLFSAIAALETWAHRRKDNGKDNGSVAV